MAGLGSSKLKLLGVDRRDRLRAVECPADVIDQIGGWSRKGVGESYGRGYQVEQLHRWLARAVGWLGDERIKAPWLCVALVHCTNLPEP